MKKVILVMVIIVGLSTLFAQGRTAPNQQREITKYDTAFPDNNTTRNRQSTKDEYIFKTYILDKLLKSNRILY
jgi:predicted small lipoprotein YifL